MERIAPGDRVGVTGPNGIEFPATAILAYYSHPTEGELTWIRLKFDSYRGIPGDETSFDTNSYGAPTVRKIDVLTDITLSIENGD